MDIVEKVEIKCHFLCSLHFYCLMLPFDLKCMKINTLKIYLSYIP